MNKTDSIKNGHRNYKVKLLPMGEMDGVVGNIHYFYEEINILAEGSFPSRCQALLHEVLHICVDAMGRPEALSEKIIDGLATNLYPILLENPNMFDTIKLKGEID